MTTAEELTLIREQIKILDERDITFDSAVIVGTGSGLRGLGANLTHRATGESFELLRVNDDYFTYFAGVNQYRDWMDDWDEQEPAMTEVFDRLALGLRDLSIAAGVEAMSRALAPPPPALEVTDEGLRCPSCGAINDVTYAESVLDWRFVEIDNEASMIWVGESSLGDGDSDPGLSCRHCFTELLPPDGWEIDL